MMLQPEGLSFRASLFEQRFVPFDDLVAVDGQRLSLKSGETVKAPAKVATVVRDVLSGPRPETALAPAAHAFLEYVSRGHWAPERAARALLDTAAALGASDVHLESEPERVGVRLRVAGEVVAFVALPLSVGARLVAALKRLSGCLPYRRDVVQEGRVSRSGVAADVRASFVPTSLGERAALRLFGRLLSLDALGLEPAALWGLERVLSLDSGLVVVAGPSGGGKTTTLYAALAHVASRRASAHLSLEDPVEQRLRVAGIPVDQVELCPERGLTGEAALVAALRQDVDVLAVGELRTPAEASLAVKAAHTGRLVLAGLHAGSPVEALQRLEDLDVAPSLLASTVRAVLHQRLETRPCAAHADGACPGCHGTGRARALVAALWTPASSPAGVLS